LKSRGTLHYWAKHLERRRTNPSFLTNDEAARDSKRVEGFVRSIAGEPSVAGVVGKKQIFKEQKVNFLSQNPVVRVGESEAFIVDYECPAKVVAIYGKEVPFGCSMKLKVKMSETKALICFLEKTKTMTGIGEVARIGEGKSFIVDFDCSQRKVLLYGKATFDSPFKLALDQNEVTTIINLLIKARALL
jgi:hypothetical protein